MPATPMGVVRAGHRSLRQHEGCLEAFTRGLAKEVGGCGITANAIAPGVILTDLHAEFSTTENLANAEKQTALRRLGRPEDVAGGSSCQSHFQG